MFSQALQSFPEPPNTSNLTASYGPLTSLWDAAQKGLFLNHLISAQAADAVHTATDSTASARKGHLVQTEQLSHLSELPATSLQDNTQTPDLLHIHQLSAPSDLSEEHTGRGFTHNQGAGETQAKAVSPNVWTNSQTDNEPSAKSLLQRLRWVALGPQFNWTTRQYETHPGVKPLPQDLVSLAQLAVKACAEADHEQTSPSSQVAAASNDSLQRGPDDTTASGNAPQSDASHPASCSIVHSCSTVTAEYNPDTALVNYYREGDTLGGHKDDAEEHDTMPIVSLSLGCEGVFLIGGHSKDETPTALMLHSGDVLVLSGHARQCYHGVPRILPGQCCCSQAQVNDQAVPAVETWMQDMRVNISIRQT